MIPSTYHVALPATGKTLQIAGVKGGEKTDHLVAPYETVTIDAEAFQEALMNTLKSSGMFEDVFTSQNGDYELQAEINLQQSKPISLLGVASSLRVSYRLIDTTTGLETWRAQFLSQSRAPGVPFEEGQVDSGRKALESAAADNLLKLVTALKRQMEIISPGAPVQTRSPQLDKSYLSTTHRWTVSYPSDWAIAAGNPGLVSLKPPSRLPTAVVGIHSIPDVTFQSVDRFAESMMAKWKEQIKSRGVREVELSRRSIWIANNIPAVEIVHEMGAGITGRSRKIIALVGGRGFVIDAETFTHAWELMKPYFDGILNSFTIQQ